MRSPAAPAAHHRFVGRLDGLVEPARRRIGRAEHVEGGCVGSTGLAECRLGEADGFPSVAEKRVLVGGQNPGQSPEGREAQGVENEGLPEMIDGLAALVA